MALLCQGRDLHDLRTPETCDEQARDPYDCDRDNACLHHWQSFPRCPVYFLQSALWHLRDRAARWRLRVSPPPADVSCSIAC